ncbi:formimidoylglutamase [Jejudonia soesokkakensis]|uniref:Formimidoylglutamase n=1 Tax=Jejudonia soesokkakensis TaxID=1323432 RepID=A0ABW2MS85_9FLAO
MNELVCYSKDAIVSRTKIREGETKVGQKIEVLQDSTQLSETSATYILVGIPEDIGVRANYGNAGTAEAWNEALNAFCNIQVHPNIPVERIALLGAINCTQEMRSAEKNNDMAHLGKLVKEIDIKVATIIEKVVAAGKIPIIIGGGHNNSFGNLKGASKALKKPINCINFDAHTDFRALEHRHSGNGFRYAKNDGSLHKYFIFGVHRNYTSQPVFEALKAASEHVRFSLFEDIAVTKNITFAKALEEASAFISDTPFGIELDMDAIANMGSSAMTPSGFSVEEARQFLNYFSANKNCTYIHICEGTPSAALFSNHVGKTISYLISDVLSK